MLTLDSRKAARTLASLRRADVAGTSVWLFEPRAMVGGIGTTISRAAVITMPDESASVVPVPRPPAGIGFAVLLVASIAALLTGRWLIALILIAMVIGLYALLYRASAPEIRQKLLASGVLVVRNHQP